MTAPAKTALAELQLVALEQAARGMVSGTLREWPELRAAFKALGASTDPTMPAGKMKARAQALLEVLARRKRT